MQSDTIQQLLTQASLQLNDALPEQDSSKLDAEILLAHMLGKSRTWLKTWPDKSLTAAEANSYQILVERRLAGEPVAYIVGKQDFWTLTLKVTPATLIPRPETEHLVEFALSKTPFSQPCRIVDLGTGTGAIALAIASERPQATIWAMDISSDALAVTEINRNAYQLDNVRCQQGHWLREWQGDPFDIIVSNPPYIDVEDRHLDELAFEPLSALVAADNGLADIIEIAQQALSHLKANGWLIFEHGFEQGEAVRHILIKHGYQDVDTLKDYAGLARVTFGRKAEL